MERRANAIWNGDLKNGQGTIGTNSGVLSETPYSFSTRFENGTGTNPEELIGAAHAGCFSMALAHKLSEAGFRSERITTQASVTLDKTSGDWTVTKIHLDVVGVVPGAAQDAFERIANEAKTGCPISRLLNAPITMSARLDAGNADTKKSA